MDLEKMLKRTAISDRGISVVVVVFNEADRLELLAADVAEMMKELGRSHEIIVVNDGSEDDTAAVADRIASQNRQVRVLNRDSHQGYGASLRLGFQVAKYPLVLQLDASDQYNVRHVDRLLKAVDDVDMVCGYREKFSLAQAGWRYWLYRLFLRTVFAVRVRDVDCGVRLYRRSALRKIPIQSDSRFSNAEILAKATFLNMLISEVGVESRSGAWFPVPWRSGGVMRDAADVFRHPQFRISPGGVGAEPVLQGSP